MEAIVTAILKDLLEKIGVPYTEITNRTVAGQPVFCIVTDNAKPLIGMHGDTLRSLDYVVKKIAEQKGLTDGHFIIDVNEYKTKQIEDLQVKARMMAERARSFQYDVELTPMSAYERLIVHATLAEEPNITTESHGEGRNRRIVIKFSNKDELSERL